MTFSLARLSAAELALSLARLSAAELERSRATRRTNSRVPLRLPLPHPE